MVVEKMWRICGNFMVFYGFHVEILWNIHGDFMECLCFFDGGFVEKPWRFDGKHMEV